MAEKKEKAEKPSPNIQYVGKREKLNKDTGKFETVAKEVPGFIVDGKTKINLPDGIEKGVYLEPEIVAQLLALRPADFKIPVAKDGKTNSEVNQ